jgi:RNA polymerase sigma-70 factor (ECF subfamily)
VSASDRGHAPVYPSLAAIIALRHIILRVLWGCGVALRHLEDVYQDCLIAAWQAIETGRFRPDPALDPSVALRRWVVGLSWRQGLKHMDRAANRREVPASDPWAAAQEPGTDTPGTLDAREALRAMARLPKRYRDVLGAFARGELIRDYAREHGMQEGTAWSQLRRARAEFLKILAGRGWRRP